MPIATATGFQPRWTFGIYAPVGNTAWNKSYQVDAILSIQFHYYNRYFIINKEERKEDNIIICSRKKR
jgi:hypothetical protein